MDIEQLKTDVAAGKLSRDKLLSVIVAQQKRIAELEELIKAKNPTARVDEPYSVKAEELRNRKAELAKQKKRQTQGFEKWIEEVPTRASDNG